jgi:NYN domain
VSDTSPARRRRRPRQPRPRLRTVRFALSDIRLVLDVAEDLHQHDHITHVVVASSDSDYSALAQRCRRNGRFYVGIGTGRTASSYQFACDEFRRYPDLAAGAVSATPEAEGGTPGAAALEDAAELVVRAVRRLAADRGESWALKAAIRPLVKRLDPTFDEPAYGFASFSGLVAALSAYVTERSGEFDHELAVVADPDRASAAIQPAQGPAASAGSGPADLLERQLRRRGLRLPADRWVMWAGPELIANAFGGSGTAIEPSFESLRMKVLALAPGSGVTMSEADFSKLKGVLWRARAFELRPPDQGISLRTPDPGDLRLLTATVTLRHLADPASEDPAVLARTLFGPRTDREQEQLVLAALRGLDEADPDGASRA